MEEEIWKEIEGFEGLYEVSNLGNVKSTPRMISNGTGHFVTKERILKTNSDKNGYKQCGLHKNGNVTAVKVHRLVAFAFLDYPFGLKIEHVPDHINGIKHDNRLVNLRFVTRRFNCSFGFNKNSHNHTSKLVGASLNSKSKKWISSIRINGKSIYLGAYESDVLAHEAYISKLNAIFAEQL